MESIDELPSTALSPYPLFLRSRSLDRDRHRAQPGTHWSWPSVSSSVLLNAHSGCVNSLALSPCLRLLLSGSDDTHLRLWPVYDLPSTNPITTPLTGATRNVFHAIFASPTLIVSSGADGIVRCHDINHFPHGNQPSLTFAEEHADVVQRLATLNERVFLSACDDGSVRVWDVREATKSVGCLQFTLPVSHVDVLHDNEFIVSGEGGLLARFDFRTCFGGGGSSRKRKRESEGNGGQSRGKRKWRVFFRGNEPEPVMEYLTSDNNIASLALSPDARHLVALSQFGLPHLYSTYHASPLASFSHSTPPPDPAHPDAFHFSGFSNIATHKVPAFLPTGTHVVCGSDDFGIYTWRIPPALLSPYAHDPSPSPSPTESLPRLTVTSADTILWGHMSLPNRVLPHPDLPYLFSCGVEHSVRLSAFGHGASGSPPAAGPRPLMSAAVCMSAFRDVVQGVGEGEDDGGRAERRTVAYFDMVVRQAAKAHARRREGRESDSSSDSEGSGNDDDEDEDDSEGEAEWSDMDEDEED